jgi:hypothetical protein
MPMDIIKQVVDQRVNKIIEETSGFFAGLILWKML